MTRGARGRPAGSPRGEGGAHRPPGQERGRRASAGRRTGRSRLVGLLALLASGVTAGWWVGRPQPASPGAPVLDPAAGLDPPFAARQALELANAHRANESLPYFRRALQGTPYGGDWLFRHDYSSALLDASLESRVHLGLPGAVARSSWERTALARESLHQMDLTERQAPWPRGRAYASAERGKRLQTLGLHWDALRQFEQGAETDPTLGGIHAVIATYRDRLQHPATAR